MRIQLCITGVMLCVATCLSAQSLDSAMDKIASFPDRLFSKIKNKQAKLEDQITGQSIRYLERLASKEKKLQEALYSKDSLAAKRIFAGSQDKYQQVIATLKSKTDPSIKNPLHEYVPGLDSLQAAMNFLHDAGAKIPGFPADKLAQIKAVSSQFQELQSKLQNANDAEQYVKQRAQQLKDQLSQYDLSKNLAGINKEVFYYQQQLVEYKNMLHDPDRLEQKLLATLRDVPAFQHFMQNNSYLGQLFSLPENYGTPASIVGLQTRDMVQQVLIRNIGSAGSGGGMNPDQFVMQQAQNAQQALRNLRTQLNSLGLGGGGGNTAIPEFKPNNQKTKTFLKRIEYGFNVQTQASGNYLPTTASIAVLIGYKLRDNMSFGVGGSYRLGMGNGLNHIAFSNQGIGIRSYIDVKAKGSIYLSGGFEYNYMQGFKDLQSIANFDIWQRSALIGLTKQIKVSKNRTSNIQLLFDALYKSHTPPSSPIVFRMGYKF